MTRKLMKLGAAVALVALSAWGALALSIDTTRNPVVRQYSTKQIHYYRFTVNFSDQNIGAGVKIGTFLKNTWIHAVACHVTVAFNAATTNVVTIGTSSAATEIVNAATSTKSIDETSLTYQPITAISSLGLSVTSDADHDIWVKYAQTGAAATAGSATCEIDFLPPTDL